MGTRRRTRAQGAADPFRSLLLEALHVRIPGAEALSLMLHRHLDETVRVAEHAHPWCQAIVYLTGAGRQWIEGVTHDIDPGSLVVLPPKVRHSFQRTSRSLPLCLLVDFRWDRVSGLDPAVRRLASAELEQVRAELAQLLRWEGGGVSAGGRLRHLQSAAVVLRLLSVALETAGWVAPAPRPRSGTPRSGLREWAESVPLDAPLGQTAERSGYHPDHLNRLLRSETGRTLGQLRAARRLEEARRLLGLGWRVGAVAASVGMPDQNYFARWFRQRTGQTPTAYRNRTSGERSVEL
jgi:AraC family L-rhamnose operon transcriptional activator RhaR